MQKTRNLLIVLLFASIFFVLGLLVDREIRIRNQTPAEQALATILHYFDGSLNQEQLIKSMASSLDPYSYHLTASEYQKVLDEENGIHEGLGIVYLKKDVGVLVLSVLPHSPAEESGITKGALITVINGISSTSLSIDELAAQFKGNEKQEVTITFTLNGVEKTIILARRALYESISLKDVAEDTVYLKIYQFWPTTGEEFLKLVPILSSKKKIIIDLRDNLGGNTEAALTISKAFINDGVLLIEIFKPQDRLVTRAEKTAALTSQNVVILVNRETSSAAEELSAAFQANKRAVIMGETTYGKSSIANYFELKDGSALHMTTGHWLTPLQESIHEKGITPDVVVPTDESKEDIVLEYALKSS